MNAVVIGAGEMATAVAISLLTQGRNVVLALRDDDAASVMRRNCRFPSFGPRDGGGIPFPHHGHPSTTSPSDDDPKAAPSDSRSPSTNNSPSQFGKCEIAALKDLPTVVSLQSTSCLCCCIPSAEVDSCVRENIIPAMDIALQRAASEKEQHEKQLLDDAAHDRGQLAFITKQIEEDRRNRGRELPPIALFCRGLGADGTSPYRSVLRALKEHHGSENKRLRQAVFVASGPIIAAQWSAASNVAAQKLASNSCDDRELDGVLRVAPALVGIAAPQWASMYSRNAIGKLFQRESVAWAPAICTTDDCDSCDVLSVLNACAMLSGISAGLVASQYAGSDVLALSAFFGHCASATVQLLNDIEKSFWDSTKAAQKQHSSLCFDPTLHRVVSATLMGAICNNVSREFAYGKRLYDYTDKRRAMDFFFRGGAKNIHSVCITETIDGLQKLMESRKVTSPFYEAMCQSLQGERLPNEFAVWAVKEEEAGWFRKEPIKTRLLKDLDNLGDAALGGDRERYDNTLHKFMQRHYSPFHLGNRE